MTLIGLVGDCFVDVVVFMECLLKEGSWSRGPNRDQAPRSHEAICEKPFIGDQTRGLRINGRARRVSGWWRRTRAAKAHWIASHRLRATAEHNSPARSDEVERWIDQRESHRRRSINVMPA